MTIGNSFKVAQEVSSKQMLKYEETFKEVVERLSKIKYVDLDHVEIRKWEVEELLDEYLMVMEDLPEGYELHLLANYILADILKDPTPYKTQHQVYSIRTSYSERITPTREYANKSEILDYLHSKYQLELDSLNRTETQHREDE